MYKSALYASNLHGVFDGDMTPFFATPLARVYTLEFWRLPQGRRSQFILVEMPSMQDNPIKAETSARIQAHLKKLCGLQKPNVGSATDCPDQQILDIDQNGNIVSSPAGPSTKDYLKRNSAKDLAERTKRAEQIRKQKIPVATASDIRDQKNNTSKFSVFLEELVLGNFHCNCVLGIGCGGNVNGWYNHRTLPQGIHLNKKWYNRAVPG